MQLSNLSISELKATAAKYALKVTGDQRLRSTWEEAIEDASEVIAALADSAKE